MKSLLLSAAVVSAMANLSLAQPVPAPVGSPPKPGAAPAAHAQEALDALNTIPNVKALTETGDSAAAPPAATAKVTGTVSYRERMALLPGTVCKVQLVDVSRVGAPAVVLGEQVIQAGARQVPFPFEVSYDPAKIITNHTYAVQARIEANGRLGFITDQRYAVITRGAPTNVNLVLKRTRGQAPK